MKLGSLFSGAGGLDMAVEQVFGGRTVWHCEYDDAASKVLAHRWPGVPNLGDITAVDWSTVEPVDVLCGGFPCQDVSAAGKRAGIAEGTRSGLWAMFADAIDALRPQYVVIENVRGLLSAKAHRAMESDEATLGDGDAQPVLRALGAVLGDLSDLGYDAQWTTVAAADVGAPHQRERVFILATPADARGNRFVRGAQLNIGAQQSELTAPFGGHAHGRDVEDGGRSRRDDAANSASDGRHERRPEPARLVGGSDAAKRGDGPVDLLPTPCAHQSGNTPENHLAKKPGRKVVTDLAILVENGLLETGGELPTPNAADGNGGGRYSSDGHQSMLPGEVRLLPTPCSRDYKDATASPGAVSRNTPSLRAVEHYLPSPAASDGTGGWQHPDKREGHTRQLCDYALLDGTNRWGKYAAAIARWEQIAGPAPSPTEPNRNGNPRLNPAFSEWMMGWPAGWVTDPAIGISRNDQLRIVGNGVVSLQAEVALRWLLSVCGVAA